MSVHSAVYCTDLLIVEHAANNKIKRHLYVRFLYMLSDNFNLVCVFACFSLICGCSQCFVSHMVITGNTKVW